MGSIVARPNGGFQAKVRLQGFPPQFRTFATKAEARRWIGEIEAAMRSGSWRDTPDAGLTLAQAIRDWIDANRHRITAIKNEEGRLRRLSNWSIPLGRAGGQVLEGPITDLAVTRILPSHIEALAAAMREAAYRGDTIRLYLALISRAWNRAMKESQLRNPVEAAAVDLNLEDRERRLEDGEEGRLLAACDPQFSRVVRFALATAARQAEIARLTWQDVDLRRRSVTLRRRSGSLRERQPSGRHTKNGEIRTLPLSPDMIDLLGSMPRPIGGGPVFGMSAEAIKRRFIRATRRAGIEDLRFHDLRHEATSRFFEDTDLTDVEIASITGHKTMQMLKHYAHLRTHRLADRLAGARRGG